MRPVRVEVLGPIRVLTPDGVDITPAGPLQRRLLALLVLRRGRLLSVDEAIEALWPARLPADAAAALQNQISRLRRAVPAIAVRSESDGYRLAPESVEVDADLLVELLTDDAPAVVAQALARWRGPAYPELVDVDDGRIEAGRLEELRSRARERRVEHWLSAAAPEFPDVLAELARLAEEQPLRERPVSLLMRAYARAGRRVEALRAYDDFRRRLADELGLDPSAVLAEQHADLLAGGPDLVPSAPAPSALAPAALAPAALAPAALAPAALAPADRARRPRRLPAPATPLLGREELLERVIEAVGRHRVVTLVGPAGVGKSRLALELGHRLLASDRSVVLSEVNATAPDAIVEQVAADLGIEPRAGIALVDRVAELLDLVDGRLVLVLDGCEHALDQVTALVARVVARCPDVSVVVTSQERLRLPGEQVLPVPPLSPDAAVELFVDRANAVGRVGFDKLVDKDLVVEITSRLDGLPLAIELAAARLHTHELAEVAAGLDERFSLLSTGFRGSARHASLRAAVSWSYDLLDERRQRALAGLSVFAGAFTAADAAAVSVLDPPTGPDDLTQLVERSLISRAAGGRYTVLETLRAFGTQQLAGAAASNRDRHAEHFVVWVEEAHRRLSEGRPDQLSVIEAALPNLRAALDHLLATGRVDLAARLVTALHYFGFLRPRPDVLAWAVRVLAADPDESCAPAVEAVAAYATWLAGDMAASAAHTRRALELVDDGSAPVPMAVANACGSLALFEGRLDESAAWYRQGAAAAIGDPGVRLAAAASELLALAYAGQAQAASVAAELLAEVGDSGSAFAAYVWFCAGEASLGVDDDLARTRFTRAMEIAELTGASLVTGVAGASRASIDARSGDPAAAVAAYGWLIPHWQRAGVLSTQWTMLRSVAVLLARLGRHRDAALLEGAVRATAEGHRIFGADEETLARLANACRAALGDDGYDTARREGASLGGAAAAAFALRALT